MGVGKRGALFVIATGVCLAAPLASCLDATEIVVQLSTDVPCSTVGATQVVVHIGSPSNIATNPTTHLESIDCTPGDATASPSNFLGNVVVLPSGGFDDVVSISVALSNDTANPTSACFPEPQGASCIYAHRQISFLPHARVTLPIVLSSVCAGVQCTAPLTCNPDTGKCESGNVDPHDCGTSCSTGDSGVVDAVVDVPITLDAPVDVPIDVQLDSPTTCTGGEILCGGSCIDPLTNMANCGGCGVDCTGGSCGGGSCTLNASVVGTCLAVVSGTVYVATGTGVFTVPSAGGSASLYKNNTDTVHAMGSTSKDAAWIASSLVTSPYLYDLGKTGSINVASVAKSVSLMAINSSAAAWFDETTASVYYQQFTSTSPFLYAQLSTSNPVPVAMGSKRVYFSAPALGEIYYADGNVTKTFPVNSPGPIVVDDPNSTTNVYDVEKSTSVYQRDDLLGNATFFASSTAAITALVWDGTTLVANEVSEISIAKSGSFVKITAATPAPKCVAVDSNAVYWVDKTKGLFKHAKP